MEDESKVIHLIGIKETRPLLSQIRHQVDKWIRREQTLLFYPNTSSYEVTVSYEASALLYTCHINVSIGGQRWWGCDSAKSLQESLERALHHLRVDPLRSAEKLSTTRRAPQSA